ncbi:unnamed protein product [Gongylonema pulchrum]|uniref:Uncharacterized protein n=1 Tax=Gongylonema pulchrum TaxID=637853 RepID=A0A183CV77_9BILA|nr:unnamed protein product [Gongylonema pulchrum]
MTERAEQEKPLSRAGSSHLEWWERKKDRLVNDGARKSVQSPVIPALRNKNSSTNAPPRFDAFEITANDADQNIDVSMFFPHTLVLQILNGVNVNLADAFRKGQNVKTIWSIKWTKLPFIDNFGTDAQIRFSNPTTSKLGCLRPASYRSDNEYIPESELEREASSSRFSKKTRDVRHSQQS